MAESIEQIKKRKWAAIYLFLILDFVQILFVSILYLDEENLFLVGIDFNRTNPIASASLFAIICIFQLFLVYYVAIAMQRSPDLIRLYPKFEKPEEWPLQYSRDEIVEWTQEVAKKCEVSVRTIYLMKSPLPNAFTFSLPGLGSTVAVHSNILDILQPDEVKAILAHEVGHISNRDSVIQIFARMPAFFVDTIYLYIYLRIVMGITNAIFLDSNLEWAGIRIGMLLVFFFFSRFLSVITQAVMQKGSREAELLSDYHAAEMEGVEPTINGLIRLGQRSEAVTALIEEIRWLESLNPERSGAVTRKELLRMIELYPLDGIDENNAREVAPWVFLSTRLRHMREVYGLSLSDDQIKEAVEPAMSVIDEKRPKKEEETTDKKKRGTVDWRTVDYDGDRRLSAEELKDLLEILRNNPEKLMFDSEVGMDLLAVSHPDFRRRVLTIADAFGL
ncbi:MAG: M48 family metalloprotease [Candidatus Thorarchaeota archaeon]|nr:MAG: M48 family metalloprotease [Candidatus Thorarchaeota archaeon]